MPMYEYKLECIRHGNVQVIIK